MPVRRYASVEDMPEPRELASVLESLRSACELGGASRAFGHHAVAPRGVVKFRSVEDADAERAARESAAR